MKVALIPGHQSQPQNARFNCIGFVTRVRRMRTKKFCTGGGNLAPWPGDPPPPPKPTLPKSHFLDLKLSVCIAYIQYKSLHPSGHWFVEQGKMAGLEKPSRHAQVAMTEVILMFSSTETQQTYVYMQFPALVHTVLPEGAVLPVAERLMCTCCDG
jgi:hypothetical protein